MATTNKAGSAPVQAAACSEWPETLPFAQRPPLFQPVQWVDPFALHEVPGVSAVSFYSVTKDIAAGAVTALQILERDQSDPEHDDSRPMLSPGDSSNLLRLTIAALGLLGDEAYKNISHMHELIQAAGKAKGGSA